MNIWHVYVLKSFKDGKFYIGSTSNLQARIKRHNRGDNISTRWRRPFELIYQEVYNSRREAMIREKKIKSWKSGDEFKKLITRVGGRAVNCS